MEEQGNATFKGTYMNFEIKDGILIATYKENLIIDENAARISVKERKEFTNCECYPSLVDGSNVKVVNKGARDFFGSDEGSEFLTASAIYTESRLTTSIANFMINVNMAKTKIPVKLFTDREKALNWLENFK